MTMYCQWCGARLAENATQCASCGRATPAAAPSAGSPSDPIERAIHETTQAAKDLADAAQRFADAMVRRARGDHSAASKKAKEALHQVADELRSAGREVEKVLDNL